MTKHPLSRLLCPTHQIQQHTHKTKTKKLKQTTKKNKNNQTKQTKTQKQQQYKQTNKTNTPTFKHALLCIICTCQKYVNAWVSYTVSPAVVLCASPLAFTREVTTGHEMEGDIGHGIDRGSGVGDFLTQPGHGGWLRDRKRRWIVQKW